MLLGFISCRDKNEADSIGIHLLKHRLIACMQILDGVQSSYLWPPGKSTVDYADETLLLVKTLESKWREMEKAVIKMHGYKNPEILAFPVSHASKKYLDWIIGELK